MSLKTTEDYEKDSQEVVLNKIDGTHGQKLQSWLHAIVVVTFDIEIGQSVEVLFKKLILIKGLKLKIQFLKSAHFSYRYHSNRT